MSWLKLFILPSNIVAVLFVFGILLFIFRRWRRISKYAFGLAAAVYIVFSSGTVAALLLVPLEYRYPAMLEDTLDPHIKYIVIMGAYAADDPLMPLSGKFNSHAMFRLVEAQNLYKKCAAQCKILISGRTDTVLMQRQLVLMGVAAADIEVDPDAMHTLNSALNLREKLAGNKFYLVTSAGHMPRAMGVFAKQGLQPVPAPTDYLMPKDIMSASPALSAMHLSFSDLAINEYAGLLYYRLTGKI